MGDRRGEDGLTDEQRTEIERQMREIQRVDHAREEREEAERRQRDQE